MSFGLLSSDQLRSATIRVAEEGVARRRYVLQCSDWRGGAPVKVVVAAQG